MSNTNAERVSHTPGPWFVEDDGDGGQVRNNTCKIADTFDLRDARLIAATPDMLAALSAAVEQADRNLAEHYNGRRELECNEVYQQCVAAIAKAEGRDA